MKLIMCQGLPGSGKSTFAKSINAFRVNKDSIRLDLEKQGWVWSKKGEKDVVKVRDTLIIEQLKKGYDVISDDCNFGRHESRLREIAKQEGAEFEIKSFMDVPVETCIERDAQRTGKAQVGKDVILGMAKAAGIFLEQGPQPITIIPVTYDEHLMPAIICDLDGTLALFEGKRGPYDASKCADDNINLPILKILNAFFKHEHYQIIFLSGREDQFRVPTMEFLSRNHVPPGPLHMRKTTDKRKDYIVKMELFDQHVRGRYNVIFVLDDRDQVVKLWRDLGLTCLQVNYGDF